MTFGELLKRSKRNESRSPIPTPSRQTNLGVVSNDAEQLDAKANGLSDDYNTNTNYGYVTDQQATISSLNEDTITSGIRMKISPTTFTSRSPSNQLFDQIDQIYEEDNGDEKPIHTVIIDCSGISTIDSAGVRCLEEVIKDFQMINIQCYLANVASPLLLMFKRMKFIDKLPNNSGIFATIHDAVLHAFNRERKKYRNP